MNFNNIFEYDIKINKVSAYIKMYEMYEKPTQFIPRESTLEYIGYKGKYYRCQIYYSLVPRFTFQTQVSHCRLSAMAVLRHCFC